MQGLLLERVGIRWSTRHSNLREILFLERKMARQGKQGHGKQRALVRVLLKTGSQNIAVVHFKFYYLYLVQSLN